MATNPSDPVDEELQRVLADPDVRASLEEWRARRRRGEISHEPNDDEARAIVGLPPRQPNE